MVCAPENHGYKNNGYQNINQNDNNNNNNNNNIVNDFDSTYNTSFGFVQFNHNGYQSRAPRTFNTNTQIKNAVAYHMHCNNDHFKT